MYTKIIKIYLIQYLKKPKNKLKNVKIQESKKIPENKFKNA